MMKPDMSGAFGIRDLLLSKSEIATYDINELFPDAKDVAVSVSDEKSLAASVENEMLTLQPGNFSHSDITLTVTGENGAKQSETFRAIVTSDSAYTFAVVPDTQSYTSTGDPEVRALFGQMADWLVEHKDSLKLQHMIHVGDVTDNNLPGQWQIAKDALSRLDGKLSYTLAVGNHDQSAGGAASNFTSGIDDYFSPEELVSKAPMTATTSHRCATTTPRFRRRTG